MRRFVALALALTMGLTLSACTQAERYPEIADLLDAGAYEDAMLAIYELYLQQAPTAPTDDPVLDRKYTTLTSALETLTYYAENEYDLNSFSFVHFNGYEHIHYVGMDAVAWLYHTAMELGSYKNSQEIAGRFTVLEDVALEKVYRYTDALGNQTESSRVCYIYGADGQLMHQSLDLGTIPDHYLYNHGIPEYTRDENGNITTLRYFSENAVNCVINYTYNDDGTLASEQYVDRDAFAYTITHQYHDGVLIRSFGVPYAEGSQDTMTVEYLYDENGKLVLESGVNDNWDPASASQLIKTVRYTYDEAGRVTSVRKATEYRIKANYTDTERVLEQYQDVREWTYTYDAEGRLIQNTYATIGTTTPDGTPVNGSYRVYTGDTRYGRYYVYSPVSAEVR